LKLVLFQEPGKDDILPGISTERGVVGIAGEVRLGYTPQLTMQGIIDDFDRLRPTLERIARDEAAIPLDQVRIGLMDDSHINAANAGGGEFYVTTGLLMKANDEQLAGVLAHEVAHADLGHVTKMQTIGMGTNIAAVLLNAFGVPGAGLVPMAGDLLIARPYGRDAEYAADRHGADILQRTGRDGKRVMAATLTWLMQAEGAGAGGFFATHPATDDRIQRVQE